MIRNRYGAAVLALAMALALGACTGGEASPSTAASEEAEASMAEESPSEAAEYSGPLEWWHLGYTPGGDTPTSQLVDDAVAAYEASHPDIDITVTGIPFRRGTGAARHRPGDGGRAGYLPHRVGQVAELWGAGRPVADRRLPDRGGPGRHPAEPARWRRVQR